MNLMKSYQNLMARAYTKIVDDFMTGFCDAVGTQEQWRLMKVYGYFRVFETYREEVGLWGILRPLNYLKATIKFGRAQREIIERATGDFLVMKSVELGTLAKLASSLNKAQA